MVLRPSQDLLFRLIPMSREKFKEVLSGYSTRSVNSEFVFTIRGSMFHQKPQRPASGAIVGTKTSTNRLVEWRISPDAGDE